VKPLLVLNPQSGGGKTGRTATQIRDTVARGLGDVEMVLTERAGHGAELAREAAEAGHPLVIAVGGDGTIHEVANGILASGREVELGIIGQGTGGDFRKTLGIEHRLDRYIEAIASGKRRTVDVGRFTGGGKEAHHFVNILSVGMGGLVDRYVADGSRALGGAAAYFGASLRALLNAELGHVRATVTAADGTTTETLLRSYMIAICNGQYFGGGMKVAPMASVDDAVFDLVALGATSKLGFALTSRAIYSGDHMKQAGTVHLRGSKIRLTLENKHASANYLLDVDGEPMGELPLEVECVPNALTVRA
jgi:YegS/Rv2252/BmrU family lipid kinase